MRATVSWLGALGAAMLLAASAEANPYYYPQQAPYTSTSYYGGNCYGAGAVNGASYWSGLPPMPFNGMLPPMQYNGQGQQRYGFPTHPYARGPRDFFMLDP